MTLAAEANKTTITLGTTEIPLQHHCLQHEVQHRVAEILRDKAHILSYYLVIRYNFELHTIVQTSEDLLTVHVTLTY